MAAYHFRASDTICCFAGCIISPLRTSIPLALLIYKLSTSCGHLVNWMCVTLNIFNCTILIAVSNYRPGAGALRLGQVMAALFVVFGYLLFCALLRLSGVPLPWGRLAWPSSHCPQHWPIDAQYVVDSPLVLWLYRENTVFIDAWWWFWRYWWDCHVN